MLLTTNVVFCSVQVRYGDVWAPAHPDSPTGSKTEYLFADNERLTGVRGTKGWVIDQILPVTNVRIYGNVPEGSADYYHLTGGSELKFFTGLVYSELNDKDYVSGIDVYFDSCEDSDTGDV